MPYLVQQYQAKRGLDYEERSAPAKIIVKELHGGTGALFTRRVLPANVYKIGVAGPGLEPRTP
jgi:hypothetical protein